MFLSSGLHQAAGGGSDRGESGPDGVSGLHHDRRRAGSEPGLDQRLRISAGEEPDEGRGSDAPSHRL